MPGVLRVGILNSPQRANACSSGLLGLRIFDAATTKKRLLDHSRSPENRHNFQRLNAEGAAAAAGALDVGVVELEAGTFEGFDVINLHAIEIHGAHLLE